MHESGRNLVPVSMIHGWLKAELPSVFTLDSLLDEVQILVIMCLCLFYFI
jgi:hypothetical protein